MTDSPLDLSVKIGPLMLKNPVMTASGTFGFGREYARYFDLNQLGAIVVKGLTLQPRCGNPGRRIVETPSGLLNSIGLQNPGVEAFLHTELPYLQQFDVPVIVNISGNTIEDYQHLADRLGHSGVAGIEINISCPNVKKGGMAFGTDCDSVASVVQAVRAVTGMPLIVKLSPNVTDIVSIAIAAQQAGANALSLINTLLGMAIDVHTWQPKLGNVVGGLSGPAVKPVALRMVYQVAQAVDIPIIGMGGIMTSEDAIEFLLAGASAIAIGTAFFVHPRVAVDILDGLRAYLVEHHLDCIEQIIGKVKVEE